MPGRSPLTDKEIRAIDQIGKHWCASGLYLIVTANGGKSYHARVQLQSGKRTWRSIGSPGELTLKEAQRKAILMSGEAVEASVKNRSFGTAFDEYVAMQIGTWKNESSELQWRQTYKDYVSKYIGAMAVSEIKPFHIAHLLKPIWNTKSETARRVRGRIETVIDYEQARLGILDINPAQMRFIKNLLPKQRDQGEHHEAPTLAQLKDLYQSLNAKSASHLALKWTIEHACRTTETREAVWSEVKDGIWTIPASRMKGGKEFKSAIVGALPKTKKGLLFPNLEGLPLSINGMRAILQKRNITWTVHGVRSCFRTWCQETGVPDRLAEAQLAHVDKDKIQRAYARSDLLEERRVLMTKWHEVINEKE
jgi:integrase